MAGLSGIHIKHSNPFVVRMSSFILALTGLMIVEFAGAFQWSLLTSEMSFKAIIAYSFAAFIPKDMVITILAVILGKRIRQSLIKAGFLQ